MSGVEATDWVCFTDHLDTCATDFKFMNVQTYGLGEGLTGILGLAADPAALHKLYPETMPFEQVTPSYIDVLFDQHVIDRRVFAFVLRHDSHHNTQSYMDIGFVNHEAMADEEHELLWLDVVKDDYYGQFWWHHYLQGIRFRDQVTGNVTYEESVQSAESYATAYENVLGIVDSGTSCLVLPEDIYEFIESYMISKLDYYSYDYFGWGYIFSCSEAYNLPTIDLLLGDVWLEIFVEDMIIDIYGDGTCAFCLQNSGDPWTAILGNVLMRNYYVIHDMDTMQSGFAPLANVDMPKARPVYGVTPPCTIYSKDCDAKVAESQNCWDGSSVPMGEFCPEFKYTQCDNGLATLDEADCDLEQPVY